MLAQTATSNRFSEIMNIALSNLPPMNATDGTLFQRQSILDCREFLTSKDINFYNGSVSDDCMIGPEFYKDRVHCSIQMDYPKIREWITEAVRDYELLKSKILPLDYSLSSYDHDNHQALHEVTFDPKGVCEKVDSPVWEGPEYSLWKGMAFTIGQGQ
jgi:hypothetical protein